MSATPKDDVRRSVLERLPRGVFIDGAWVQPARPATMPAVEPSTGESLCDVARGSAQDIDAAVQAARAAFEGPWARMRPFDRQRLILRFAQLVDEHYDELTLLDVLDMGVPITPAGGWRDTLQRGLHFYAAMAGAIRGETIPSSMPTGSGRYVAYTVKEPAGVIGAIVSWNGPRWQTCKKFGATLATGCTLVMKPSEEAALTVLRMTELAAEAGVPDGVINVVTGGPDAGVALAEHPSVDRIIFVGSIATGRKVLDAAKGTLKRVTLELGGKSPHIVFADADLQRAAPAAAMGAFANTGQLCVAGSRLFVQREAYEPLMEAVVAHAEGLRVGPSEDPDVQIGPLISARQRERVREHLAGAGEEGARVLTGGADAALEAGPGFFVKPTVLADVTDDMRVAREEIFGPVLSAFVFDDVDEVIRRGNDTHYGLTAGVWTRDLGTAQRVIDGLRVGTVWVNDYLPLEPALPHGGFKMSGHGREGGMEQIEEYLEVKSVLIRAYD